MQAADWVSTGGDFSKGLPRLSFPLDGPVPDLYAPQSTILRMPSNDQVHAYLWCYPERRAHGSFYRFNPSSLSAQRVNDIPRALERLSKRFHFDNAKPLSVWSYMKRLSGFMYWLDDPLHQGRYESVLSDPDVALEALKRHHSYLRQRMQSNHSEKRMTAAVASIHDYVAVKMMSLIHDREFANDVEIITFTQGDGVKAPKTEDVAAFMACVQGVFDSVIRVVFDGPQAGLDGRPRGELQWQSGGQERSIELPTGTHLERVMELGCMAYAALCIGDSGANLASIQSYEEPEDMQAQLAKPEKLTLRHRVVKFRAGGKEVPVHLTATTVTRLRLFLRLREALRVALNASEIGPMFVQCAYGKGASRGRPLAMIPLERNFTEALRGRFRFVGINLPQMTMQQLRTYKQGKVATEHNPKVTADMLGNTVATAIRKYNKITEAESRSAMAPFLASLTSVVLARSKAGGDPSTDVIPTTAIPAGGCADHGHPKAIDNEPLVEPDCKKTEGCFFCDKYHVHADEEDSIKLMSCRAVLERLGPRLGGASAAERVYDAVIDRIDALLTEIKRIDPGSHERARTSVVEEGQLSRYWAGKLQQLHLLGLLAPAAS